MGGAAVGLPALEMMAPAGRAWAAKNPPPTRFVVSYGGISTGAYQESDELVPDTLGPHYDVKRALRPLADLGIRDHVSVVTGLLLPWQEKQDGEMPPGGRTVGFHYNTVGPQVAGTHTGPGRKGRPKGPTADQLVADAIAGDTRHRVLAYRVQPVSYVGGNQISGDSGRLSWRREPDGSLHPQDPIVSPRVAYESLFGGFVPRRPRQASRVRRLLDERRSVLDLVGEDMQRLMARLGQTDRARMERHFEEVRGLERRLQPFSAGRASRNCRMPEPPGTEEAFGRAARDRPKYGSTEGYSDEERRADVLSDLVAVAFACDLCRVASYMLTEWKCYMNMFQVAGWKSDMHELTHGAAGPRIEPVSDAVGWCVKLWGQLVAKLHALPEPDGSTVLDHTALVLFFEGGHGDDPEGNRKNSPHSTQNMAVLVAGRAGGLASGRHVRQPGRHPANAMLSAMNAAGVNADALGEVRGNIPELFT